MKIRQLKEYGGFRLAPAVRSYAEWPSLRRGSSGEGDEDEGERGCWPSESCSGETLRRPEWLKLLRRSVLSWSQDRLVSSSSSALEKEADRDRDRSAASASEASPWRYGGLMPCEALAPLLGLWAFLLGGMVGPIQPRARSWRWGAEEEEEEKKRNGEKQSQLVKFTSHIL